MKQGTCKKYVPDGCKQTTVLFRGDLLWAKSYLSLVSALDRMMCGR